MATKNTTTKNTTTKNTTTATNEAVDYSTNQKIEFLFELQQIDSKIDQINLIKGELPLEVADLEDVVAGLENRHETLLADIEGLNADMKNNKEIIETAKTLTAKYNEQQKEVRNNREYESIGKEIEYQQLEIELAEKHIKEFTVEIKNKKKLIEETKDILQGRKVDLENKKIELNNIEGETEKEIGQLTAESEKQTEKIDAHLLDMYKKIRSNVRNGLAVVEVSRDACGGCFNRIPPQRQLDIRTAKKIIVCEYCGRILTTPEYIQE